MLLLFCPFCCVGGAAMRERAEGAREQRFADCCGDTRMIGRPKTSRSSGRAVKSGSNTRKQGRSGEGAAKRKLVDYCDMLYGKVRTVQSGGRGGRDSEMSETLCVLSMADRRRIRRRGHHDRPAASRRFVDGGGRGEEEQLRGDTGREGRKKRSKDTGTKRDRRVLLFAFAFLVDFVGLGPLGLSRRVDRSNGLQTPTITSNSQPGVALRRACVADGMSESRLRDSKPPRTRSRRPDSTSFGSIRSTFDTPIGRVRSMKCTARMANGSECATLSPSEGWTHAPI